MDDNSGGKGAGQRKKRQDRDTCINNLKLSLSLSSPCKNRTCGSSASNSVDEHTYTKSRSKHHRGSLQNVSSHFTEEQQLSNVSHLRRCHSLAVSRDNETGASNRRRHRRSQLIPRARLVHRRSFKDRYFSSIASYENLVFDRTIKKRAGAFRDYVAQPQSPPNNRDTQSPSVRQNSDRYKKSGNFDSLESNYPSRTRSLQRDSYENLYDAELSLPNYYPDVTDDDASGGENTYKYNSSECLKPANEAYSYDENILLTTNSPLYDELKESSHYGRPKTVRTIRGHTPYYKDNYYFLGKPQSLPIFSDLYLSDLSLSETEFQKEQDKSEPIYDKISRNSVDHYETNSNFDEIKLNNANIEKVITPKTQDCESLKYNSHSDYVHENPIYDEVSLFIDDIQKEPKTADNVQLLNETQCEEQHLSDLDDKKHETIKTCVQVEASGDIIVTADYKTVVKVDDKAIDNDSNSDKSKHSHKYLKEFLESQKGSKKPLQNFISKKISRAFGERDLLSKKNSKLSASDPNLSNNQYCSLPDITVSRNLQKCEKIDNKLRKWEKIDNKRGENRFIVNIGRHFDVTANTNVPVDFEVKISKIPKSQKSKKLSKTKDKKGDEKKFLDAVKNLKHTLNAGTKFDENHNIGKPEVIGAIKKTSAQAEGTRLEKPSLRRSHSVIERSKPSISVTIREKTSKEAEMEINGKIPDCNEEFQQKLGSMRNYWDKMLNGDKCKEPMDPTIEENVTETQVKVDEVIRKFEPREEKEEEKPPSIVQLTKQVFEPKVVPVKEKISPLVKEACGIFENPYFDRNENSHTFESLNPNIVELIEREENCNKNIDRGVSPDNKHKSVVKTASLAEEPEFDHVRYKVMKSDLFQKKIFANCEKESQFDGLMQYLQDYSFQELLIDNNIVIIEPIRSKIPHEASTAAKSAKNVTPLVHKSSETISSSNNSGLRRHFFYHPVRVNKEVNDEELPNPDTVKQVRQFFEGRMKTPWKNHHSEKVSKEMNGENGDPDKDNCSATDTNSNQSNVSGYGSQENLYDSLTGELCCEQQYVSEDVLEKIRERGTCITYYGGRVLAKRNGQPSLTKAIMDEIKGYEQRNYECKCRKNHNDKLEIHENGFNKEGYYGLKFRLLKSNSCSSRLELVGTNNNVSEYRKKFLDKQKQLIDEHNLKNKSKIEGVKEGTEILYVENATVTLNTNKASDKDTLNEKIKMESKQPKIIAEEMKSEKRMMQWNGKCDDKPFSAITFNNKTKPTAPKVAFDFHNYDKVGVRPKQIEDMEFEAYEIAGN